MTTADGKTQKFTAAQVLIGKNAELVKERARKRVKDPYAKLPELFGAGRAIISVGGNDVAYVQGASWSVSTEMEEIRTVDSVLPWELAVGQTRIRADLTQFMDPSQSPESQLLFATMQSILHQPVVFIEFFDKLGTKMFSAKGMFESITGQIGQASLASLRASFVGYAYAHNTVQRFTPYAEDNLLSRVSAGLGAIAKVGF